jgi:POT family proton-dependent oligopeptide transporter
MAGWFFCSFAGNILAGALGSLWSVLSHATFFAAMAALAASAAAILHSLRIRESSS